MTEYISQYTGSQIDEGIEKASKALTTPDTAPESISLVAVDTNNAQSMLALGDGLSVADGVISASGGGEEPIRLPTDSITVFVIHSTGRPLYPDIDYVIYYPTQGYLTFGGWNIWLIDGSNVEVRVNRQGPLDGIGLMGGQFYARDQTYTEEVNALFSPIYGSIGLATNVYQNIGTEDESGRGEFYGIIFVGPSYIDPYET